MDYRIYLAILAAVLILVGLSIAYHHRRQSYVVAEPIQVSLPRRPFQPYEAYKPYGPYATLDSVSEPPVAYSSLASRPPQAAQTSSHPQVPEEVVETKAEEDHERPSDSSWKPFQRWRSARTQDRQRGREAMRPLDLEMQDPGRYQGGSDVSML
jgi:hypothetical protein